MKWGGSSLLVDLDQFCLRAAQGNAAVSHPALNRVAERRPSDDIDFGMGNETEIKQTPAHGSSCMMAMDSCPLAAFYVIEHAASAVFSFFASASSHALSIQVVFRDFCL